jgi:hypothetical protein
MARRLAWTCSVFEGEETSFRGSVMRATPGHELCPRSVA